MRRNLKEARQKAGMTQKQVAEYLKMARWYHRILRMETGKIWFVIIVSTVMICFLQGCITGCVLFAIWVSILRST